MEEALAPERLLVGHVVRRQVHGAPQARVLERGSAPRVEYRVGARGTGPVEQLRAFARIEDGLALHLRRVVEERPVSGNERSRLADAVPCRPPDHVVHVRGAVPVVGVSIGGEALVCLVFREPPRSGARYRVRLRILEAARLEILHRHQGCVGKREAPREGQRAGERHRDLAVIDGFRGNQSLQQVRHPVGAGVTVGIQQAGYALEVNGDVLGVEQPAAGQRPVVRLHARPDGHDVLEAVDRLPGVEELRCELAPIEVSANGDIAGEEPQPDATRTGKVRIDHGGDKPDAVALPDVRATLPGSIRRGRFRRRLRWGFRSRFGCRGRGLLYVIVIVVVAAAHKGKAGRPCAQTHGAAKKGASPQTCSRVAPAPIRTVVPHLTVLLSRTSIAFIRFRNGQHSISSIVDLPSRPSIAT